MSNINRINISLLKNYKSSFDGEQLKFTNTSYNTFNSSYLKQCSDPYILNMSNKLNDLYKKIENGYSNINKWWSDYNTNIESLENYLSGNGQAGNITESSVRNYVISNLSELKDYDYNNQVNWDYHKDNIKDFYLKIGTSILGINTVGKLLIPLTPLLNSLGPFGTLLLAILGLKLGNHFSDLADISGDGLQNVNSELKELFKKYINDQLEFDDLLQFGNTVIDSAIDLVEALWSVDTACTLVTGGNSILFGVGKFTSGVISDLGPIDLLFLNEENEEQFVFSKVPELKDKINNNPNYNLSEKECSILLKYYYTKDEKVDKSTLNALIKYFENQYNKNGNTPEYKEILSILNNMNDSNISEESQKTKFSTIFRLNLQSIIDDGKYTFYEDNSFGGFIDENSFLKFDSKLASGTEVVTEDVLIYGTHSSVNYFLGFGAGFIPFMDLLLKKTEYKEGFYFSDELGKEQYELISEVSYIAGQIRGILAGIGLDVLIGGMSTPAKTAKIADTVADIATTTDKVVDGANTIDNVIDTATVIDKASDGVGTLGKTGKTTNKLKDILEGVLDFLTGGLYKSAKSSIVNNSFANFGDEVLDMLTGGVYKNAKSIFVKSNTNRLDDVGDAVTSLDKIIDVANSADNYMLKINLDDASFNYRDGYGQMLPNNQNIIDDLKMVISLHDKKYGKNQGIEQLRKFAKSDNNYLLITSNDGARDILKKYDVGIVKRFLNQLDNNNGIRNISSSIDNTIKNRFFKIDSMDIKKVNSIKEYNFSRDKEHLYVKDLLNKGYSLEDIAESLLIKSEYCCNPFEKRQLSGFCYEVLQSKYNGYDAANIIRKKSQQILDKRGLYLISTNQNGIKVYILNDCNISQNKLQQILKEVNFMPDKLQKKINKVVIYDTFNPYDFYWHNKYNKNKGSYFRSNMTGGGSDSVINIWNADTASIDGVYHESGHCVDKNYQYSNSPEYHAAMNADYKYNGKQSVSTYGTTNPAEDFAESVAAYYGKKGFNLNNFPNRKAYFDNLFRGDF